MSWVQNEDEVKTNVFLKSLSRQHLSFKIYKPPKCRKMHSNGLSPLTKRARGSLSPPSLIWKGSSTRAACVYATLSAVVFARIFFHVQIKSISPRDARVSRPNKCTRFVKNTNFLKSFKYCLSLSCIFVMHD